MRDLFLIKNLPKLKEEIKTTKRLQFYHLMDQCDRYEVMHVPVEPPKESTTYFCQAIMNFSLLYILTEEDKYLHHALRYIRIVCGYPYWGNAHLVNVDLSASWIMFGLSTAYNWLYDALSSEDKKLILDKLIYQSDLMFKYRNENLNKGWATNYYQNHNWINMTGLACCGYAIEKEYPKAKLYIEAAKENFAKVFSYLPEDGSDYEGVTYWRYGALWLFIYADLLKDRENIDYFERCDFLKNTVEYRIYQSASELRKQMNFGDCHDRYSSHSAAIYYKTAKEYQNGYAQKLGNMVSGYFLYEEQYQSKLKPGILPEAWLEVIWFDPEIKEENLSDLPHVKKFDDLGLISIRTGFQKESTAFSFKCGYPGGKKQFLTALDIYEKENKWILALSHHHPDNLSYILTKNHSYMAIDDGYNRNIMPTHHNTLLVDRKYSESEDKNDIYVDSLKKRVEKDVTYPMRSYYGEMEYFHTNGSITMFKATNTNIYQLDLQMTNVSRMVFTDHLKFIVFIDDFESELLHQYQSILNTDVMAKKLNENKFLIRNGLEEMTYYTFSEEALAHEQFLQTVSSVMTTQEPDKKCIVHLNTLLTENVQPSKKHRHIEIISFIKKEIVYKDHVLSIGDKKKLYLKPTKDIQFDGDYAYVDLENGKAAIANGTALTYRGLQMNKKTKQCMIWGDKDAILK